jgi:hypothetical protein
VDASSVGSVTLVGTAISHNDVADLLRQLAKEKGMSSMPVVASSVEDTTALIGNHRMVKFTVTEPVDDTKKPTAATAGSAATGAATGSASTTTPTTTAPGN